MVIAFLMMNPFHHKFRAGFPTKDMGGEFNGYVAFDGNLPLSYQGGKSWDDDDALDNMVDVHGGITFDSPMSGLLDCAIVPITSIPDTETLKKLRCIGFDTLHYGDTKAKWGIEAVKKETLRLMEQIEKLLEK
jgi:hypothetical protein